MLTLVTLSFQIMHFSDIPSKIYDITIYVSLSTQKKMTQKHQIEEIVRKVQKRSKESRKKKLKSMGKGGKPSLKTVNSAVETWFD